MDSEDFEFNNEFNENYSLISRKILRILSENSRCSVSELSKKLNLDRKTISKKMERLEQELGIRYMPEFNEDALGFSNQHIVIVKFEMKPDYDMVKEVMEKSYIPQLVVQVKGTFDLFIYANAFSKEEYVKWDKTTQIILSKYGVSWSTSDVAHTPLGFFPVRNKLLERSALKKKYLKILKALNEDSRMSFHDLSKNLGMHFNTVAYNFGKLVKSGYIKRFTISIDPPKGASIMTVFGKYTLSEGYEEDSARSRVLLKSNGMEYPLINNYPIVSLLVGGSDALIMGIMDNYESSYKYVVSMYKEIFKRQHVKVEYGEVARVLLGRLPLRSIDTKKEYSTIRWTVEKSDILK